MTRRCAATAIALVAVLATGAVVAAPQAASAATAATATDIGAQLTVAPRNAGVLQSKRPLVVDVAVRNGSAARIAAGQLIFSLDQAPAASAAELLTGEASIADPSSQMLGRLALTRVDVEALAPGASTTVTARITADDLNSILTPADGARRLFVGLKTGSGVRAVAESAVVRMASDAPSIGFGTVIPMAAPAGTTGVVDVDAQASLTRQDGAWTQALEAAQAMPSAVLALDPAVLASIRLAGVDAPESAQQLLTDLAALSNTVVPLPYADGDVALQRAAGLQSASPTTFAGATTAPAPAASASAVPAPSTTAGTAADSPTSAADLTDWSWTGDPLLWPVPGTASPQLLTGRATSGPVLLSASDLTGWAATGPLASVAGARVLVADPTASKLLSASTADGIAGAAALAPLAASLATDAVTGATSSVLAVAGRGASAEGLARSLSLLRSQRWIRGDSLASMTGGRAVAASVRSTAPAPGLTARAQTLVAAEKQVQRLASAVEDPDALVGPQRLALLGLLSAQWRRDGTGWAAAATTGTAGFEAVADQVSIIDAGPITVGGSDGSLRVAVQNGLAQAVDVVVRATSSSPRLRVQTDGPVRLQVPPGSVGRVVLQVDTIANGPARVALQLEAADGAAIGGVKTREVTVYSGFDTIVAVVLLTLLGLLLALGVYRNVTRRRRPKAER